MASPDAVLRSIDLLRGVPDEALAHIRPYLRERSVAAGSPLFREGDYGDAVYLITDGSLRIEKDGILLAMRGAGECVGEFALIDAGLRSASAIAVTDATVFEWPRDAVWDALTASPTLSQSIFNVLVAKLREDVAAQVSAAIAREQVLQDLRRAGEIQRAMLPAHDLDTGDLVISGRSRPTIDVGGDYFDHAVTGERTASLLLADVSGHGIYAALLVAMAKACFQTQLHIDSRTTAIAQAMNRSLWLSVRSGMLMTCVSATIDAADGSLSYTNAGHPAPLHFIGARGEVAPLDSTDPLLGLEVFRQAEFHEEHTAWERGDILLMYTDGVTEATNDAGSDFGRARLEQLLRDSRDVPADRIRDRIFDELDRFTGSRPQEDDATVVVVRGR
jgi:sigma-B regulation protein RsbU (phosphoserine phosphatase)